MKLDPPTVSILAVGSGYVGALRAGLGIEFEVAPPYMHWLNGYAEVYIRVIKISKSALACACSKLSANSSTTCVLSTRPTSGAWAWSTASKPRTPSRRQQLRRTPAHTPAASKCFARTLKLPLHSHCIRLQRAAMSLSINHNDSMQ